eukprot:3918159-Rhodomonas_salina.2
MLCPGSVPPTCASRHPLSRSQHTLAILKRSLACRWRRADRACVGRVTWDDVKEAFDLQVFLHLCCSCCGLSRHVCCSCFCLSAGHASVCRRVMLLVIFILSNPDSITGLRSPQHTAQGEDSLTFRSMRTG